MALTNSDKRFDFSSNQMHRVIVILYYFTLYAQPVFLCGGYPGVTDPFGTAKAVTKPSGF